MSDKKHVFERLPQCVIPLNYKLKLIPDLVGLKFGGFLKVTIKVTSPSDRVTLNALDLKIQSAFVTINNKQIAAIDTILRPEHETVTLMFPTEIPVGQTVLQMEFLGELNDKLKGFYRSKYITKSGEERYSAVSQFAATDARRCFPCWDEPALKATFDLVLTVPTNRVALSNMPVKLETTDGDLKTLIFETTPVMSTYLVAVVVGEYDFVEGKSADGVLVRVFTPLGKKEQGLFALEVATKVLPYYNEYFNIAYPLPKMDLIAISDFAFGAMENWGLVTYRETRLLVDPENTSLLCKQSIALTVGHEIAHQWFGNLVTMEWWTNLWLNEGYASFVEFLCVHHLFPEYDIWTQFVTDMYTCALDLDCLKNSHPIEVPVSHPSEIEEIFDAISYNKGASVIRMLHHYIGDEDFRKGMNLYLTRYQYKNTTTEDLWAALEESSSKPVAEVMSTWTKQMGFPVVKVQSKQANGKRTLTLTQQKFCADGLQSEKACFWMIPINISTPRSANAHTAMLDQTSTVITLDNVGDNDWVKINPGTIGFYRCVYPPEMLREFVPAITDKTLPPLDRLGLVDDLFALVQAGQSPTVEVLKLIDAYRNEDNYTVWSSITNSLVKLQVLLSHTDLSQQFDEYGIHLYRPAAEKLGWNAKPNEIHLDTLLRTLVLSRLVSYNCPKTVAEAKQRFADHIKGVSSLPADLRSTCYKAVLQTADVETYNKMLALYRATDLHEEKNRISRALGSIRDIDLLKEVIKFAMSDEVRAQDAVFVVVSVAMNPKGRDLTWNYFKENWKTLLDQYKGSILLKRLVKYVTENFASEERAMEVETFFKKHEFLGTERTVQQSIETIRLNAAWLKRDLSALEEFLKN